MRVTAVELFDRSGNWAVLRLPGRQYPGVFLQGDTFASLVRLLLQRDDSELPEDVRELRAEILNVRRYYEGVLEANGIEPPY
jgi:hypothetical protein